MEQMDILTMAPLFGSIAIALVIWHTNKKQLDRQAKIDSARLSMDMIEAIRDEYFRRFTSQLYGDGGPYEDEELMERFLNHVDKICGYHEEGIITSRHMEENHLNLVRRLKNDGYVVAFMDQHADLYLPIKRLFKRI